MSEINTNSETLFTNGNNCNGTSPNDMVCIDVLRVYDSCGSKDCLENMDVLFTSAGQQVIDKASSVKIRSTSILNVIVDLESVPFHKGYYSVNITFYFGVSLDVFLNPISMPVPVNGLAVHTKQVVLYGSEGNVKIYSSDYREDKIDYQNTPVRNLPKATVQTAEPIGLSAKLLSKPECRCCCSQIPEYITNQFGGELSSGSGEKTVLVSIGLFSIVQIERNVQMRIPSYDFCVPCRECACQSDDPCTIFSKIDFPTDEFFPVGNSDCGCRKTQSNDLI